MFKNVLWNTIGNIYYYFCQWLLTILVVHLASFEEAGYLSLAMSVSSTCLTIGLFNMRNYQVTDIKGRYTDGEYVGSRLLSVLAAFAVCIVIAFSGNSFYQAMCIVIFMVIRSVEAFADVFHGIDQMHDRFDTIGISYILRGTATVAAFSAGLVILKKLEYALLLTALLNTAALLLFDLRRVRRLTDIRPAPVNRHILELFRECAPLVVFSFLIAFENSYSKNVLQAAVGTTKLGIYSSIATPTLIVQVFATVVYNPFLPRLSSLYQEEKYRDFRRFVHQSYLVLLGLIAVINIGAMLIGRWGLTLLFGESILEYYYLFMPVVWVTILNACVMILSSILVCMRQIKWIFIGVIADFIVFLLSVHPFIDLFGMNGASYVQIFCFAIYVPFMMLICEIKSRKRDV